MAIGRSFCLSVWLSVSRPGLSVDGRASFGGWGARMQRKISIAVIVVVTTTSGLGNDVRCGRLCAPPDIRRARSAAIVAVVVSSTLTGFVAVVSCWWWWWWLWWSPSVCRLESLKSNFSATTTTTTMPEQDPASLSTRSKVGMANLI